MKPKPTLFAPRMACRHLIRGLLPLILCVALTSCRGGTQNGKADIELGTSSLETVAPTALPTSTSTPTEPPEEFVVVLPAEKETEFTMQILDTLRSLSEENGMLFRREEAWDESRITTQVRGVAWIQEAPDMSEIAPRFPQVHFFVIDVPSAESAANVSVIGRLGGRADQQGFIAGYLAAVITHDWRIGVLTPAGSNAGKAARLGFIHGAIFYCGLCRPVSPPYHQYPVYAEVPIGADDSEQRSVVDILLGQAVQSVYVFLPEDGEAILSYLGEKGIHVIGVSEPLVGMEAQWVATVRADWAEALRRAWENFLNHGEGIDIEPPVVILNPNSLLFTPGRQQFVEKVVDELLQGWIDTGVDPLSGEPLY